MTSKECKGREEVLASVQVSRSWRDGPTSLSLASFGSLKGEESLLRQFAFLSYISKLLK